MVDSPAADPASTPDGVRPARPGDVEAIGAVHARSWSGPYAPALPPGARAGLDGRALAVAWRPAVESPPSPRHRVLVAVGDGLVAGFAALGPSRDADADESTAELVALEVDPAHARRGHGSRLLTASADTARELGARRLQTWVLEGDEPRREFLVTAGLGLDGATRERALPGPPDPEPADDRPRGPLRVREVRLSAWLVDPEGS